MMFRWLYCWKHPRKKVFLCDSCRHHYLLWELITFVKKYPMKTIFLLSMAISPTVLMVPKYSNWDIFFILKSQSRSKFNKKKFKLFYLRFSCFNHRPPNLKLPSSRNCFSGLVHKVNDHKLTRVEWLIFLLKHYADLQVSFYGSSLIDCVDQF